MLSRGCIAWFNLSRETVNAAIKCERSSDLLSTTSGGAHLELRPQIEVSQRSRLTKKTNNTLVFGYRFHAWFQVKMLRLIDDISLFECCCVSMVQIDQDDAEHKGNWRNLAFRRDHRWPKYAPEVLGWTLTPSGSAFGVAIDVMLSSCVKLPGRLVRMVWFDGSDWATEAFLLFDGVWNGFIGMSGTKSIPSAPAFTSDRRERCLGPKSVPDRGDDPDCGNMRDSARLLENIG